MTSEKISKFEKLEGILTCVKLCRVGLWHLWFPWWWQWIFFFIDSTTVRILYKEMYFKTQWKRNCRCHLNGYLFQNGGNDEIYLKQTVEKTEIHDKWILCPDISTLELRIICIDLYIYSINGITCEKISISLIWNMQ